MALQNEGRIYTFVDGKSEGNKKMKQLLGGKGANLCEMARFGLHVPPGFTITTAACQEFYQHGGALPPKFLDEIKASVALVEKSLGRRFGDANDPLLFSVRSGAAVSMPGMMDTVLNLGMSDASLPGLIQQHGKRWALDCYRRLLHMFGDVVLNIPAEKFEEKIGALKAARSVKYDVQLTAEDLEGLCTQYKAVFKAEGKELPQDPWKQLQMGIEAVFRSWNSARAIKYREINKITGLKGTAVNIQAMVYGNINDNSGTGVCFTRNPANGKKELFGEYLANAQGEDVVAGIRTPVPILEMAKLMPTQYAQLVDSTTRLEAHMQDMQDVEFTIQDGELFILQCRSGKRTGHAALAIAVDMFSEGIVTCDQAVMLVEPRHLDQLLHPTFSDEAGYRAAKAVLALGLAASPGAAVGRVVFTAEEAEAWHNKGEAVILVRQETSPEDVGGMHAAQGILTARGGMTSHAAVVARGWGKPCVCGCETLHVNAHEKVANFDSYDGHSAAVLHEGDWVSLNGTTGEVVVGKQECKEPEISGNLATLMTWVDSTKKLGVMANADTPEDAAGARRRGAEGVGLCRTEHMFFSSPQRIAAVRRMIAAEELQSPAVEEALSELKGYQKQDFEAIFTAMEGLPVTIRLLDPPLHEFLPHDGPALTTLCKQLAKELHSSSKIVRGRLDALREANPMMGLRGCRLGVVHPEISFMQASAVFEAASAVVKKGGRVYPHIMVPLVGVIDELEAQAEVIRKAAQEVAKVTGVVVPYKVGSMIEVPRAALTAGQLAKTASFFSFGTNDLTQMTFGISRDDAQARFLTFYTKHGLLPNDPFETIDEAGVGELVRIACERGRAARPELSLGVCGEHGGDPASIDFFSRAGLDYVSCSPLRVPVARLAAAQAAIRAKAAKA